MVVFFFKQKTAYEMRISDWSSDVCSSDLHYCSGPIGCQEPAGPAAAWVRRSYYVSRHDVAPELFADPQGGLMVFAAGEANDAGNLWDARNGRWNTLGGRTAGPLVSFAYPEDRKSTRLNSSH